MNKMRVFAGPGAPGRYTFARSRRDGVRARAENITPARCEVRNTDQGAEILLYGVVDSEVWWGDEVTAEQIVLALAEIGSDTDVTVRINSPGGLVTEGMAMYNALVAHRGRVTTQVDGIAASIASVVMMAGEERVALGEGATVMIHNAWGFAIGDHRDMSSTAALLQQMDGQIAGIYANRGTISKDDALAAMGEETWYTAEDAIAAGFLTGMHDGHTGEVQNCIRDVDLSGFQNVPQALITNERRSPAPVAAAPAPADPAEPEVSPIPEDAPAPVAEADDGETAEDMQRRLRLAITE